MAQISLRTDRFASFIGSGTLRFPGLCILAWLDDRMGIAGHNCLMAFACVIRAVSSDTSYILIRWDLVQRFG